MPLTPKLKFSDPDAFEEQMQAVAPGLCIRPLSGRNFESGLSAAILPRSAVFTVDSVNMAATRPAAGDLCGVTIPERGEFTAAVGGRIRPHAFSIAENFLLHPDRDLDYRTPGNARVLVANILSSDLLQKADALTGGRAGEPTEVIPAASPAGGALTRFAYYFWGELQRTGGLWDCPTALAEMEDCLASHIALASTEHEADSSSAVRFAALVRAEDYLMQHLTTPVKRSELARVAGVSIRTVSRAFRAHHGVSAMAWLKERRLEAVERELRAAVPGELTVTEVALRYGFENPGRLAAAILGR